MNILDTGIKNVKNVSRYTVGEGALNDLPIILNSCRSQKREPVVFFIDEFFKNQFNTLD